MAQDTPDWQKLVIPTADLVPGQDVPDWQRLVREVTVDNAGQDWPDWQRVILVAGTQWNIVVEGLSPTYWWKMNETTGSTAADSADSNPGTYEVASGAITLGEHSIIAGSTDTCPLFTPNADMLATDSDTSYHLGPVSMAIAFKGTVSPGTHQGLCGLYQGASPFGTDPAMYVNASGEIVMGLDDNTLTFKYTTGSSNVLDGNAHLGVLVYSGDDFGAILTGYLDGEEVGTFGVGSAGGIGPDQLPIAGYATAGESGAEARGFWSWQGYLQSFIVWDTALTSADVTALQAAF